LNLYPGLRFLRSPWWPDRINYGFTLTAFAIVVALFVGPKRAENVALNLFWAWWWPLILAFLSFVGRVWCCLSLMIYGEVTLTFLWLSAVETLATTSSRKEGGVGFCLDYLPFFSVGRTLGLRCSLPLCLLLLLVLRCDDFCYF